MDVQQEIIECEEELSSLLSRVLAGTLKPIESSLKASEERLADLEQEIGTLKDFNQEANLQQQKYSRDLNRLRSQLEESSHTIADRVGNLLADSQTTLIEAHAQSHLTMGNELQHHASEKAEWIAQTLEGQIAQSTAQQQFSVAESRDVLVGHVLNAQANNKAMEQRYGELSQTMQSLKADIEKVHGEVSAWQGQVLRLHEESTQQSRAAIDTAFRSVRRMHAITLVMVAGCLLQGILTLWPIFMK